MAALRICPRCGAANDSRAAFCGACATQIASTSTALVPVTGKVALPVLSPRDRATLGGVAISVAVLAVRIGGELLRRAATRPRAAPPVLHKPAQAEPNLIIRRRVVSGDRTGPTHWTEEEIEVRRRDDDKGTYDVRFK